MGEDVSLCAGNACMGECRAVPAWLTVTVSAARHRFHYLLAPIVSGITGL